MIRPLIDDFEAVWLDST
jgi:hypothetical protein